jgi:D-lactate dehydrogenase (cytochrome)
MGGTVATNASGAKTFKYGATRKYVQMLEIILPTGDEVLIEREKNFATGPELILNTAIGKNIIVDLPNLRMPSIKNAAGYYCKKDMDAIDLFIGSEGTLGLFSQIKLKLLDTPEQIVSAVFFFSSEENAMNFITSARDTSYNSGKSTDQNTIDATAIEYFDVNALRFLKTDYSQIPNEVQGAVWIEQNTTEANQENLIELWMRLFEDCGGNIEKVWFAATETDRIRIIDFRHHISEKVNEYITSNNLRKLGTDIAVPEKQLLKSLSQFKNEIDERGLDYVIYGHIGNSHLHINLLPKDDAEFEVAKKVYDNICHAAIKAGGTFSAEHGVGKNKTRYLIEMYGNENVEKMKNLKKVLDPNMILGRGNIFKF